MTVQKYYKNNAGTTVEGVTVETSAGAADASKIPNTNALGILDPTLLNGTVASAGAGSAAKVVQLDAGGKIDSTVLPAGTGSDSGTFTASEAISAGDYVNIWNSTGAKVRKADASNGRMAHGFTRAAIANAASGTVYFEGTNDQVSGRTPGATQFLSGSTPGAGVETAPSTSGQIVQVLGFATGTTSVSFEADMPITLA